MSNLEISPANQLYEETALVLQGGGALGSYQAGVYEALCEASIEPDWFAGISIGAINAAILAGNKPENRLDRLHMFWRTVADDFPFQPLPADDTFSRRVSGTMSTLRTVSVGISGFFRPRFPPAWLELPGAGGALSVYDTAPLRRTLEDLIDFDVLNSTGTHISLGAVNVRTGNFSYFDNRHMTLGPEHVMASGALPPGLPPVEIDGEYFWDGGLVSNTPLSQVLGSAEARSTLVFQVDLFSATGPFPETIGDVEERRKDIVYSSRTRMNTDTFREKHALRQAITRLAAELPEGALNNPEIARLAALGNGHAFSIIHLIYRRASYDGPAKDFEFSRRSMVEHWAAGLSDARRTLRNRSWRVPPPVEDGIAVFDINRSGVM